MGADKPVGAGSRGAAAKAPAPRAVTLLCDSDRRRQEEFVARAEATLRADDPGMELLRFYGFDEKTVAGDIFRESNSNSLFAARKLIVVAAAEKMFSMKGGGLEPLRHYLANPNPAVTIILRMEETEKDLPAALKKIFADFPALTAVIACRPDAAGEAVTVRQWFGAAGLTIAEDAVRRLAELRAADADGLAWCLEHLRDGVTGGVVTREAVERALAGEGEGNLWGFLDAVGARQPAALVQLGWLLRDTFPLVLLAMVRGRIRELTVTAELLAAGRTAGFIGQKLGTEKKPKHPYVVNKLVTQARFWQVAELRRALVGLGTLGGELRGVGERLAETVFLRGLTRLIMRSAT